MTRAGPVEPKFKTPKRPSKLDPYAERWLGLFEQNVVLS